MSPHAERQLQFRSGFFCVSVLVAALLSSRSAAGQDTLNFNWSSRPKDVGQSVTAPTLELGAQENVKFVITNVNDIFYTYQLSCIGTPQAPPDLSDVFTLLAGKQLENAASDCDIKALQLIQTVQNYLKTPDTCDTACDSKPLAQTASDLQTFVKQIDSSCTNDPDLKSKLATLRQSLSKLLNLPHTVTFNEAIYPDETYTCTLTELRSGSIPTPNGSMKISVTPTNVILTLSLGPMFSAIRNPTYSAVMVPNATSTGTNTVLGVQGNSISSNIAALVNIRLPLGRHLTGNKWGVDLSAGPVVRLNSSNGTTPAGFFAGLSLRVYRYVFITPGLHVGQFSDFPQGFTHAGQTIPPSFGTPQGVPRTTVKFGLAFTFVAKDFKTLGKSTGTTTNQAAAAPAPPKPGPPAPPANQAPAVLPQSGAGAAGNSSTSSGISVPSVLDFGALGSTPITKSLPIKNTAASTINLKFDPDDSTNQLDFSGLSNCLSIASGSECDASIVLKPGSNAPASALNIHDPSGKLLATVTFKWQKQTP